MTTETVATATTQVYRVYIKATPEAVWDAITMPEWTERMGTEGAASMIRRCAFAVLFAVAHNRVQSAERGRG
jgi:uncharacterized protein YndB with AHSA1/START domain